MVFIFYSGISQKFSLMNITLFGLVSLNMDWDSFSTKLKCCTNSSEFSYPRYRREGPAEVIFLLATACCFVFKNTSGNTLGRLDFLSIFFADEFSLFVSAFLTYLSNEKATLLVPWEKILSRAFKGRGKLI